MSLQETHKPIKIKNVRIKNRIAMAPLALSYSSQDGYVTPQDIAHLARRAKGGFGLIVSGVVISSRRMAPFVFPRTLCLFDDSFISGMAMLVEGCHAFDAKIFLQLFEGAGRQAPAAPDGTRPYAPSAVPWVNPPGSSRDVAARWQCWRNVGGKQPIPQEMTTDEILTEEKEYASTCRRAVMAGFDGIEIHACNGYLINQFLSPRANKRTDLYGGSFENRTRFVVEVVERILEAIRDAIPVGIRMSAAEHVPEGFTVDDVIEVAKKLEDLGIAFLHLSDGSYESPQYLQPDSMEEVEQHLLKEAKIIKDALHIPVITPSVHDPFVAERAIKEGQTDMISLGRQSLADPDWPNRVKAGKIDEIKRCKRDNVCGISRSIPYLNVTCSVNPEVGFEQFDPELFPKRRVGPAVPRGVAKLP